MESQQQQQQQHQDQDQDQDGGGMNKSNSSYLCRQTSSRWTPTSEQIRILKELYYNNGIRSPTADQIQSISARLKQYGKIEGKNVFYWFQNHKARERQKKRFITTPTGNGHHLLGPIPNSSSMNMIPCIHPTARLPVPPSPSSWMRSSDHHHLLLQEPTKIYENHHLYTPNPTSLHAAGVYPSSSSSSHAGVMGSCGYGSVAMEKSFRECSISPGDSSRGIEHNFGWVGVDPVYSYSSSQYHSFVDKIKPYHDHEHKTLEEDDEEEAAAPEIETLPLFPMHADANTSSDFFNIKSESLEHAHYYVHSRASLELTLNSYTPSFEGFS